MRFGMLLFIMVGLTPAQAASPSAVMACTTARIPAVRTISRYDLADRTIEVRWRDARGQRDVVLRLPYEPETGFRGCSRSALAHLRLVHVIFQAIDRERAYQLERAEREKLDLSILSRRYPAVLSYGSLQENCARYKRHPTGDDFAIDSERRIVTADMGWDAGLGQNVVILLPYNPRTNFAGCSPDARALLRSFK